MAFVQQSRLIRTAQRNGDGTVTHFEPPQQIARFPGIVRSLEAALNALSPVPPEEQWGGYELRYDPSFRLYVGIAGTHSDATNLLVCLYDVWESEADQTANPDTPPYRNTHTMGLDPGLSASELRQRVLAHVTDTVIRHAVAGTLGDQRDQNLVASQTDPTGVLNKARPLNRTARNVESRDDSAPELPNPEDGG
jgi:hypothetical protein